MIPVHGDDGTAVPEDGTACDPMDPTQMASLKHWGNRPDDEAWAEMTPEGQVDCGWGRLIFGQTYDDPARLAEALCQESPGRRDVALYMLNPNVVLSYAPQELFLDPSLTYRVDLRLYEEWTQPPPGLAAREARPQDEAEINRIYTSRGMVPVSEGYLARAHEDPALMHLVATDERTGAILGTVTGVDHVTAINDPDNGASLWSLAVDAQADLPRVGEALVRTLCGVFRDRGRAFMDLSVMHDNRQALRLYDKLGFEQVPVYCLKHKNPINEQLFLGPAADETDGLNIYARLIIDEARRRGISVEVEDAKAGLFRLTLGGRSIACRESLSELTSAVAMSRCDDKAVTRRLLERAGLRVPAQTLVTTREITLDFLERYKRVVVKPARGEQGHGITVDLQDPLEVEAAVERARRVSDTVLLEEFVRGEDVRIIVIEDAVVAAAVRRPAQIRGDGRHSIAALIEKQSRRRAAATRGESEIPLDDETARCVRATGHDLGDILPEGVILRVRKTANLHTGGTIHDVTDHLHPRVVQDAVAAARALDIPVVGFDFMMPDIEGTDYVIIEANERPGLANHEPRPTAERFIDLLFPQTRATRQGSPHGPDRD